MKKVMLALFILIGVLSYSNSKCELKARVVPERLTQQSIDQGLKAKYSFTGVDKKNKNLYYYMITLQREDGKTLDYYTVVDISNGSVYIKNTGEDEKLQKLAGEATDAICK